MEIQADDKGGVDGSRLGLGAAGRLASTGWAAVGIALERSWETCPRRNQYQESVSWSASIKGGCRK